MTTVEDVVNAADMAMGAKAVFGPISSHVLCFGGRGSRSEPRRYFSIPGGAAARAVEAPWVFAVGGGANVRPGFEGRALNVVRASCVYGETAAFVDEAEAQRLAQWPVAIALHDVWELDGHPHLITDLGLSDRRLLAGSQDGIVKPAEHFDAFWEAVREWPVTLKAIPFAKDFIDRGKPVLVSQMLPGVSAASEEGKAAYKLQLQRERDRDLSRRAKELNVARHGMPTCEACDFGNADQGLFDAHHPNPLAAGIRTTLPEHLIILCPTCHRRAHRTDNRLVPYTLDDLRAWVAGGRQ